MTGASRRGWVVVVLLVLATAGCSTPAVTRTPAAASSTSSSPGSGGASPATITDPGVAVALVAPAMRDGRFTAPVDLDRSTCLAERLVDDLGPAAAVTLSRVERLGRLSPQQRSSLAEAFDDCFPASELAGPTTTAVLEAFGLPDRDDAGMTRCLADALDGHVGDLVLAEQTYDAGERPPRYVVEALTRCTPRDILVDAFARGFQQPGISASEARCASEVVVDGVRLDQLIRVGMSGGRPPRDVLQVFEAAFARCSTSGA